MATDINRPTLGQYMSLVCFQYLRFVTEEVADRAPVVSAGRLRGYELVTQLGLLNSGKDPAFLRETLDNALGLNGTRLCLIKDIVLLPNGGYQVQVSEVACVAGRTSDTPQCLFSLGVFIGALSGITGTAMTGVEKQCTSCGAEHCVYEISPI
ncbi:hypothetical protein F8S13_22690 [Chloroflexia bacterium SDU3-3]|nr:hypothetical protein F8S13_22690 [Chloroflexia bacterium SDU3-3]